jgi:hypothetical protein
MTIARSPWEVAADIIDPLPNPYLGDPVGWVRDVLGEDLWSKQEAMMSAVTEHRRIVVKAGHSVGKTRALYRLVAWFVSVHPIGEALVVVTSDNDDQIKGGLWRELIALDESFGLPGKLTLDGKWHAGPSNKHLLTFGRKPSDRNPTGLQGSHARHLLVIIDECCGLPKELWEAADSLASNEGGTILACGNPTDPTAYMAEVCKPGSGWEVQQIKSTDAPEFTGEEVSDALRGVLASREWVEAKRKHWGEASPAFVARILAEFPDISNDTLIMPKWIEAAIARTLERTRRPKLGADIARYGDDKTTIYRREGGWVRKYHEHDKTDTMVKAGQIAKALRDIADERDLNDFPTAVIDDVGVGAGVLDRLQEQNLDLFGFNGGSEPRDRSGSSTSGPSSTGISVRSSRPATSTSIRPTTV